MNPEIAAESRKPIDEMTNGELFLELVNPYALEAELRESKHCSDDGVEYDYVVGSSRGRRHTVRVESLAEKFDGTFKTDADLPYRQNWTVTFRREVSCE